MACFADAIWVSRNRTGQQTFRKFGRRRSLRMVCTVQSMLVLTNVVSVSNAPMAIYRWPWEDCLRRCAVHACRDVTRYIAAVSSVTLRRMTFSVACRSQHAAVLVILRGCIMDLESCSNAWTTFFAYNDHVSENASGVCACSAPLQGRHSSCIFSKRRRFVQTVVVALFFATP